MLKTGSAWLELWVWFGDATHQWSCEPPNKHFNEFLTRMGRLLITNPLTGEAGCHVQKLNLGKWLIV
jgi:hypothetical protein